MSAVPQIVSECIIASGVAGARRRRRTMMHPPHGFTAGCICGNELCVEPAHLQLQQWKTFGGNFTDYAARIAALKMDESIELPEIADATEFSNNVRQAACMSLVKCIVRTLPSGGIRVIRVGEWYGEVSTKTYPVLMHKQAAPCNGLRPSAFFLGFMSYSSLHWKDIPKYQHCQAKGCAFPANGNGEGLCRHHFHFFDYSVSRLGRNLDMDDIYGNDKQAPRFYVSWFWKRGIESLKFQQGGTTSWWKEQVTKYQTLQTGAAVAPPGIQHGISGMHHGQGPTKPHTKRSRRKTIGQGMGGHYTKGNHPSQKPEKRWSREELEIQATQILFDSGFFAPSQKHYFDDTPKASPVGYAITEPEVDDEQERDLIIAELSKQQSEFEKIFGA